MPHQCPCDHQLADRTVIRITSFFALLLLTAGLFSRLNWFSLLVCFDYFIRGFTHLPISPLKRAAQAQAKILRRKPKMINAGPRIYDARIGFFVTALITILSFSGLDSAARVLTQIMIVIAGLAAFLGVCIGCCVHAVIRSVREKRKAQAALRTRAPEEEKKNEY